MATVHMQLRIMEMELAMKRLRNNGAYAATNAESAEAARSEGRRMRYTSLLKDVLVPMPTQESLVSSWFNDVEATFHCYNVPLEWRAGLMLPRLNERARACLFDSAQLKEMIITSLKKWRSKVSDCLPQSIVVPLLNPKKQTDETWSQLAVRLENYLIYFLNGSKLVASNKLEI